MAEIVCEGLRREKPHTTTWRNREVLETWSRDDLVEIVNGNSLQPIRLIAIPYRRLPPFTRLP